MGLVLTIRPAFCCLHCKNLRIKVFLMLSFFSCCYGKSPERMGRVVPNHWNINFSLGLIKRCVHVLSLTLALGVLRSAAHSRQLFTAISAHQEWDRANAFIFIQTTASIFSTSPAALWDVFQVASSEFRGSHLWRQAPGNAGLDRGLLLFGRVLRHHRRLRLPLLAGCHRGLYLLPEQVPWKQQRAFNCKCFQHLQCFQV